MLLLSTAIPSNVEQYQVDQATDLSQSEESAYCQLYHDITFTTIPV